MSDDLRRDLKAALTLAFAVLRAVEEVEEADAALDRVRALADKWERMGRASASDYDRGGRRCALAILAALEVPGE